MFSRFMSNRNDLTRGDDPFVQLQRELGRVVEDVFRGAPGFRTAFGGGFAPSLDVKETNQGLEVTAELPGVSEDDIELSLENDILTIRGEKRDERKTEQRGLYMQERSYGSFQRSLRLPFAPDPGSASANFDKGVLRVTLPRPQQAQARDNRIPIQGASAQRQPDGPGAQGAAASEQQGQGQNTTSH
ncbi:MAG: Hsp20/alpha crystallin family protein [Acetobacteraceae bacterium]|nr:Hsp20/alpha crystallin family protein [Acetobacteraceae bacterium]